VLDAMSAMDIAAVIVAVEAGWTGPLADDERGDVQLLCENLQTLAATTWRTWLDPETGALTIAVDREGVA
jgi:hypothetical protein